MFSIQSIILPGIEPISFSVEAGQCIGISGDSGCGKSRLLRAIADMDEHDGVVSLGDTRSDDIAAFRWRSRVALLPAESQWWCDTVGEHFPADDVDLSALGFERDTLGWEPSRCSSGERQRLGILRLLANRPEVLLLDEPTTNLDPDNTVRLEQLVRDYMQSSGACCIWVSHNRLQLDRIADRQMYFIDGRLQEQAG